MMKKILYFVLAATGLATLSIAAKPEPELIQPSSPWNADYAEESCILVRSFGTGDDQINLLISRYSPGDSFALEIDGKKIKSGTADSKAKLQFGPNEKAQEIDFVFGSRGKNLPVVLFRAGVRIVAPTDDELKLAKDKNRVGPVPFAPVEVEREANVRSLSISGITKRPIILATGSLGKAFAEMRKCTDNLVTSWGIDVAKHQKLQRPLAPIGSIANWISYVDYPPAMLAIGNRSLIRYRVIVDTVGKPKSCVIQQSNRLPEFDTLVCKSMMNRARFNPALDENGVPILSYWVGAVFFTLPSSTAR